MSSNFLLLIFLTCFNFTNQIDICEILDANYCFYFSDSSCYINLCQCTACSTPDKAAILLQDDVESNSTSPEKICPSWCSHVNSNDTILNIMGKPENFTTEEISFECEDLEKNCLATKGYNGHCYFYEKNCETNIVISARGNTEKEGKRLKKCLKFQRKCHEKYPKKLAELSTSNNTTTVLTSTRSPVEQCLNYQTICAQKYPKHFACKQFRKKCKEFALPSIQEDEKTSEEEK